MASNSIQMAILAALEDLVDDALEKFCFQLLNRKGKRVPASKVMKKTRVQITSVLVQTYTEKTALKVVLQTLKDAGFEQTARKLEKDTQKLIKPKSKAGGASGAAAGGRGQEPDAVDDVDSSKDPAVRFLRTQKLKLISCLGADLRILQLAEENELIVRSEYRRLKSMSSADDTVRDLIDVVIDKGPTHCRGFLQILKRSDVVGMYPSLEDLMKDWK